MSGQIKKLQVCFVLFSFTFIPVATALEKTLWDEYRKVGSAGLKQEGRAYWAEKFINAAKDPTIPWKIRQVYQTEAAVLFGSIDAKKSKEAWDLLYSDAVRNNDKPVQVKAMDNMIHKLNQPGNEKELKEALVLYSKYQEVLSTPPRGYENRFQKDLADSFLRRGRFLYKTSQRIEGIKGFEGFDKELQRDELSASAVKDLKTFYDLGSFRLQHKSLALFELGKAYANNGNTEQAILSYKKVAKMPDSMIAPSRAMWRAVEIEYRTRADRIKPMEQVLANFEPDTYWNQFKQLLLFEYLNAEEWDKAIEIASQITNTGEGDKVAAYNSFLLATALRRSGRLDEANSILEMIQRKYPNTGTAKDLATRETRIIEDKKNEMRSQVDGLIDNSIDGLIDTEPNIQETTDKTQDKSSANQSNVVQKQPTQSVISEIAEKNSYKSSVIYISSIGGVLILGCLLLLCKLKKNKTSSQASNDL